MTIPKRTVAQRFAANIDASVGNDACWPWRGTLYTQGYGLIYFAGKNKKAHRVGYEMFNGPVPEGLCLDHLCRNRACVNPAHLEPVTPRENLLRGASFSATNAAKTHCKRGHELIGENVTINRHGHRNCQTCAREWRKSRRAYSNEHRNAWRAQKADELNARARAKRAANPEETKAKAKAAYERNRERIRARQNQWRRMRRIEAKASHPVTEKA